MKAAAMPCRHLPLTTSKKKKMGDRIFYLPTSQGRARHRRHFFLRPGTIGRLGRDIAYREVGRAFLKIYPDSRQAQCSGRHGGERMDREENN